MTQRQFIESYIREQWLRLRRALIYPQAQQELLCGATLKFFEAGTAVQVNVYSDQDLLVAHPNPVVADSSGGFPAIFLEPSKSVSAKLESMDGRVLLEIEDAREFCGPQIRCPHCDWIFKVPE